MFTYGTTASLFAPASPMRSMGLSGLGLLSEGGEAATITTMSGYPPLSNFAPDDQSFEAAQARRYWSSVATMKTWAKTFDPAYLAFTLDQAVNNNPENLFAAADALGMSPEDTAKFIAGNSYALTTPYLVKQATTAAMTNATTNAQTAVLNSASNTTDGDIAALAQQDVNMSKALDILASIQHGNSAASLVAQLDPDVKAALAKVANAQLASVYAGDKTTEKVLTDVLNNLATSVVTGAPVPPITDPNLQTVIDNSKTVLTKVVTDKVIDKPIDHVVVVDHTKPGDVIVVRPNVQEGSWYDQTGAVVCSKVQPLYSKQFPLPTIDHDAVGFLYGQGPTDMPWQCPFNLKKGDPIPLNWQENFASTVPDLIIDCMPGYMPKDGQCVPIPGYVGPKPPTPAAGGIGTLILAAAAAYLLGS